MKKIISLTLAFSLSGQSIAIKSSDFYEKKENIFKSANRICASTFQILGCAGLRRLAFPHTGFSIQDFMTIGTGHLLSAHCGPAGKFLQNILQDMSTAHFLNQCIDAYGFGTTTLMATVGLSGLSYAAPYLTQRFADFLTEKFPLKGNKELITPWTRAFCAMPAALIPSIQLDEQGAEIKLPFSRDYLFLTKDWHAFNTCSQADQCVFYLYKDAVPQYLESTTLGFSSEKILKLREVERNLHVYWGTEKDLNLRIFQYTSLTETFSEESCSMLEKLSNHLLTLDKAITRALTFPLHQLVEGTPIKPLIPIRHQSDQRELFELLLNDPQEFKLYLNHHYKKYVHETSYSTAPAIFGTLFYDMGVKTGGHVYQYHPQAQESLLFDQTQFLFVPSVQDKDSPIILCELNNQNQRDQSAKKAIYDDFTHQIEWVTEDFFRKKRNLQARFLALKYPEAFQDVLDYKSGQRHRKPRLTLKMAEDFMKWQRGSEPLKTSIDNLAHTKSWEQLSILMKNRPDLQERGVVRIGIEASLRGEKPFKTAHRYNEDLFNTQRQRLDLPARLANDAQLQNNGPLHEKILYDPASWQPIQIDQERHSITNLLHGADGQTFEQHLQVFQSVVEATQERLTQGYPIAVLDEAFYKGIVTTKILDHMRQGEFFPVVELQSGTGRVDLALIPRQGGTSVLFEFKDAKKSSKSTTEERLKASSIHALNQMKRQDYGVAFNRFPGVTDVWRVGASFIGSQMCTKMDSFHVPRLSQTPPMHFLIQGDDNAFKYNLDLFVRKHISYHDLNQRNPSFMPAFLSGMMVQSMLRGDIESVWVHPLNSYKESIIFFLPAQDTNLFAFHLKNSQASSMIEMHNALEAIYQQKPFLKQLISSNWFYDSTLQMGLFNTVPLDTLGLDTNVMGNPVRKVAFDKTNLAPSFAFEEVITNLDKPEHQGQLTHYLKALSEFENALFPESNRRNEATLQGYFLGSLIDHTQQIEILNVNESGGPSRKRPDFLIRKEGTLTALELKQKGARSSLQLAVEDAIQQTRQNEYLDGFFKADKVISIGIAGNINHHAPSFQVLHDQAPYSITHSPAHLMVRDPSLSYHETPERLATSRAFASHLASPPSSRKKRPADVTFSPQLCGIKKLRDKRSVDICGPTTMEEKKKAGQQLETHGAKADILHKGLYAGHTLTNLALPMVKALVRGDIEQTAEIPAMIAGQHLIGHQVEHHMTKIAARLSEGPLKKTLLKQAPLVRQSLGGIWDLVDLGQNINAFTKTSDPEQKKIITLNICADTGYIAVDISEIAGFLAGSGSVLGPAAMAASLAIAITQQMVQAGFQLDQLKDKIALTEGEAFTNFWRFFIGLGENAYLKDNIDAKEAYKFYLQHLADTYLKTGEYGTLVLTLNDLQRVSQKTVRDRTFWEDIADGFRYIGGQRQGPCYYDTTVLETKPTLFPKDIRFAFQEHLLDPDTASSSSRILEAPPGTRFICNPNAQDITLSDYQTLNQHYTNCKKRICYCQKGDYETYTQRMALESSEQAGKNFCLGSVGLTNVTRSTNASFFYILDRGKAHFLPGDYAATVLISEYNTETHSLILGNKDDHLIFGAPKDQIRIDGGSGQDVLQVRKNLYSSLFIRNIETVLGSPESQFIAVPQDVSFIDGQGGGDTISFKKHKSTDQSTLILRSGDVILPKKASLIYVLPDIAQQGRIEVYLSGLKFQTHWIRLKYFSQLKGINPIVSGWEVNLSTPDHLTLVFNHYDPLQHHIRFICEDLLLNTSIQEIQPLFYRSQSVKPTEWVDLRLVGNRTLSAGENLEEIAQAYLESVLDLHSDSFNLHIESILTQDSKTARVQAASHESQNHVLHIKQPPDRKDSLLFVGYGKGHHHYVFKDWFEKIYICNNPQTLFNGKYEILEFPLNTPFEIKRVSQELDKIVLDTFNKETRKFGMIELQNFYDYTPLRINYEGKSYALQNHNEIEGSKLETAYFLSFNQNHLTVINTNDLKNIKYLYIPELEVLRLREKDDMVFYVPQKQATIILKGGCIHNGKYLKHLKLTTPFAAIALSLGFCSDLETLDAFEDETTQALIDFYDFYDPGEQKHVSFSVKDSQRPKVVYHKDPFFIYDVQPYPNQTVALSFKNNEGEQRMVYVADWDDASSEQRPLFIHNNHTLDIRNFETSSAVQTIQTSFQAPDKIFIPSQCAHELGIKVDQGKTHIIRQTIRTVSGKPHRHLKRYIVEPDTLKTIFFYTHAIKNYDVYHNQTSISYVLDPERLPLEIKGSWNNENPSIDVKSHI